MTRWIFLGDDSRWQFACWLLKVEMKDLPGQGLKTLLIKHGKIQQQISEEENTLIITTYNMLPFMEVFIPAYSEDLELRLEEFDKCAVFETHPLGRESTENLASLLEAGKNEPMTLFVLMDLIDEIDFEPIVDVKTRKIALNKKGRDAISARGEIDVLDVLHWHRPMVKDLRRRIQNELKDIRNQVNLCGDYYAEYIKLWRESGCLRKEIKNYITRFDNIKGRPHIWKCYNEAAQKILFPKSKPINSGIYGAIDLYRKILYNQTDKGKNLAAFIWNVEVDVKRLYEKFYLQFVESMKSPKKYHDFLSSDEFNSEHIYLALVDRPGGRFYGIKEDFFNRYEHFVCKEVLEIVRNELEDHIDNLRGMIE